MPLIPVLLLLEKHSSYCCYSYYDYYYYIISEMVRVSPSKLLSNSKEAY